MRTFASLLTLSLIAAVAALAAGYVYADRDNTKIFRKPSVMSKPVAVVKRGEALTVIKKTEKFYRVRTRKGIAGYALKSHVTSEKPGSVEDGDDLDNLLGAVLGGGRSDEMVEDSSSHSIRGLKDGKRASSGRGTFEDAKKSAKAMKNFGVSSSDLKKFQRDGKVGDYAR